MNPKHRSIKPQSGAARTNENKNWDVVSSVVVIVLMLIVSRMTSRNINRSSIALMAYWSAYSRSRTLRPTAAAAAAAKIVSFQHHFKILSRRPNKMSMLSSSTNQQQWRLFATTNTHAAVADAAVASDPFSTTASGDETVDSTEVVLLQQTPNGDTTNADVEQQTTTTSTTSSPFQVTAPFPPAGDQPAAIQKLADQIENYKNANKNDDDDNNCRFSILRGVTGTGKTLVMSHVIARTGRPTLVLCHNKTLAAQLARELRNFLRHNAVELFVSYYNHYRPEFYSETTNTYMAKKSSINADLDTLRHRATRALLTRRDVVIVASVSCIYGLGLPKDYLDASTELVAAETSFESWDDFVERLEQVMLYERNDSNGAYSDQDNFERGQYQVTELRFGDTKIVTLWPPHDQFPMQIELRRCNNNNNNNNPSRPKRSVNGDDNDSTSEYIVHAIRQGNTQGFTAVSQTRLFPARHHVVKGDRLEQACLSIEEELQERVKELTKAEGKFTEAERLQARVLNDLHLLRETGFCKGIENYSRHFAGRQPGEAPDTLLDYLELMHGKNWLLIMDESHVTLPQLRSMYAGDQARKRMLVKHGYRLPSALDNRPLRDEEFWDKVGKTIFVSATPSWHELEWSKQEPVDMVIRPTYVCDPEIEVRPTKEQLEDLLLEVKTRASKQEKTLAITLTKRDSEDLASYLQENGVNSTFLHSGLSTMERSNALRSLQSGEVDCLVGVNCLREGLDLPQVSLVAVLNADSEGFLRSDTALLQVVGRAARNTNGRAIFYANRVTDSMRRCIESTSNRRQRQLEFNRQNGCQMISTKGSSMMSFFDLLKDQIKAEQNLEIVGQPDSNTPLTASSTAVIREPIRSSANGSFVETDHIPTSPGVYFWKDEDGDNLYIGKAANLRSRVKSYLAPNAKHGKRIKAMLQRAVAVDILITPSERDALVLESKLIKHHQPRYNVLLKDDEHYPYICASIGDQIPRLSVVPQRESTPAALKRNKYFGPYTSFKEINNILDTIENQYRLKANAFLARHGNLPNEEYKKVFNKMLLEVFGKQSLTTDGNLSIIRRQYEEAGMLFDSKYNQSRDIVTVLPAEDGSSQTEAIVSVLQLREGLVVGHFSYSCNVPVGFHCDQDYASAALTVLSNRHYPAGEESSTGGVSWFPDAVLMSHPPIDAKSLKDIIRQYREKVENCKKRAVSVTGAASSGQKKKADTRALTFAHDNARLLERKRLLETGALPKTLLDGSAAADLAKLLNLEGPPSRIECYDISHTQGEFSVGSRVVFENGRPVPHLYRSFNIKTVEGIDDYASLQEVLERRFKRAWVNGAGGPVAPSDPWALPDLVVVDGGKGQLNAAVDALSRSSIVPSSSKSRKAPTTDKGRTASVALCAIAKNEEEVFVHGRKNPVNDRPDTPAVLLLRALRDESHRFALNRHRRRRSLSIVKSAEQSGK